MSNKKHILLVLIRLFLNGPYNSWHQVAAPDGFSHKDT